jgi:hypothetical protein
MWLGRNSEKKNKPVPRLRLAAAFEKGRIANKNNICM